MTGITPLFCGERFDLESVISLAIEELSVGQERNMSDRYIIEVESQAAGIVVRSADGYRFFAASHPFHSLEGRLFASAREAERAARRLLDAA